MKLCDLCIYCYLVNPGKSDEVACVHGMDINDMEPLDKMKWFFCWLWESHLIRIDPRKF